METSSNSALRNFSHQETTVPCGSMRGKYGKQINFQNAFLSGVYNLASGSSSIQPTEELQFFKGAFETATTACTSGKTGGGGGS